MASEKAPLQARLELCPMLNEHDAAQVLGVSVASLRRWRMFNRGPRVRKIGTRCLYHQDDLRQFIESCPTVGGEVA